MAARWVRRLKSRRAGVYAYRTDRHTSRSWLMWREWGYVGMSNFLEFRHLCHQGLCLHRCVAKDWMDLNPKRYVIRVPWFLAGRWFTLSLETVVIFLLRPRYNWQKNLRKDKAGPRTQRNERRQRDEWRRG